MSLGFIFPGQGSQYVGMGKDIYQFSQAAKKMYDEAEAILQFPLKEISFEGPDDELKQTRFTQPAIFVHSLALNKILAEIGIRPHATAGHSLGEYSALVAAGAFDFEEGLRLVKLRGELMQYSGEKHPGTMAAIIGLSADIVIEVCQEAEKEGYVQPANYNSPGQIVISGSIAGVYQAMTLAKEKGARMVTELVVSGAFHSPLMKEAVTGLTQALDKANITQPKIPVYSNVSANQVKSANEVRDLLKKQLLRPVMWKNIIENMSRDGYNIFYEVGPSKVLTGLNKRINRDLESSTIGTKEDILLLDKGE